MLKMENQAVNNCCIAISLFSAYYFTDIFLKILFLIIQG